VLEADECHAPPADHQLTRIGAAEPDHQIRVGGPVDVEQFLRPRDRLFRRLHQVHGGREVMEIAPVGRQRRRHDLGGVRAVGVENVVAPVGVEDRSVGVAILPVGRFPVGCAEHLEEIRKKIDQHGGTI
jgi:hypothetical protein